MSDSPIMATVTIPQNITEEQIRNLLCVAFEGGIGYWACIEKYTYPPGTKASTFKNWGDDKPFKFPRYVEVPMLPGGIVHLIDDEDDQEKWGLTRDGLIQGIGVMARDFPSHFNDFLNQNDDAITADVFVQCCLFGEIVYG